MSKELWDKGLAARKEVNRPNEFKTHVRGALTNGCTREEIREVLLQVAVYCGMPAGVEAFRLAREAIKEYEQEKRG